MNAYAATARIDRPTVRPVAWAADRREPPGGPAGGELTAAADEPSARTLEEILDDLRTAWAQTTFYLFDPESWR